MEYYRATSKNSSKGLKLNSVSTFSGFVHFPLQKETDCFSSSEDIIPMAP
jgi:hypothetical protein